MPRVQLEPHTDAIVETLLVPGALEGRQVRPRLHVMRDSAVKRPFEDTLLTEGWSEALAQNPSVPRSAAWRGAMYGGILIFYRPVR